MKINEIKGAYNAIYSLGENCIPALKLRKFNLREFAGPLDWVGSPNLPKVTNLLRTNFSNFLISDHLIVPQYASDEDLLVVDTVNHISFNHDFKTHENTLNHLPSLPQVQAKYEKRINHFIETQSNSERLLFIRTEANIKDTLELENILSQLVKYNFCILIVNHSKVTEIVELDWKIKNVCAIEMPNEEIWEGNDLLWERIFQGITLISDKFN
ncbi:DUF1796 family putative cysteine peptidase [Micrococcus luteus]|uniref:Peptidase n=1 Tax=Niallia taxi TaxID=2499688 RepID=A0A437K446_9BACI|nr:DUF1796 family putative cysteine peptidase [Niallia taxi]RVT57209.1 peptidase [Niallia taxi]